MCSHAALADLQLCQTFCNLAACAGTTDIFSITLVWCDERLLQERSVTWAPHTAGASPKERAMVFLFYISTHAFLILSLVNGRPLSAWIDAYQGKVSAIVWQHYHVLQGQAPRTQIPNVDAHVARIVHWVLLDANIIVAVAEQTTRQHLLGLSGTCNWVCELGVCSQKNYMDASAPSPKTMYESIHNYH